MKRDAALVALVALTARLVHAAGVATTPFFEGRVIDAQAYHAQALHLARTGDFGGAFYQPPLYPAFLGLLYRAGLTSAWSVAVVQALLGSLTCVLLWAVGQRLSRSVERARLTGLVTGLSAALYGPLILFDIELLPPCCVDLLLASSLLLALRSGRLDAGDALLGLIFGLGVVGWPPLAILLPVLVALRARTLLGGTRRALVVVVGLCAAAPLAVTAGHNARHGGEGVVVSYNLGINLWLGNAPNWRDTWRARPGAAFEPELERPDREGVTEPSQRSRYFVQRVWREVAAQPAAAIARTGEKLYYAWYGREIRRDQDLELLREASPLLRALLFDVGVCFPFGLLAPLALVGAWQRRRDPDVLLLFAGAFTYSLVLAVFFVSARYRLPLVLLLLPMAADQAVHWATTGERRSWLVFASLVLVCNLPNRFTQTFQADAAERGILEAQALRNQGQLEPSRALSVELARRFPSDPNALMLAAESAAAAGRCAEALPWLERTIARAPRTATPRLLLASCLEDLGDVGRAERELGGVLSLHPFHPVALQRASELYRRQRRFREARALDARFAAAGYAATDASTRQRTGRSGS